MSVMPPLPRTDKVEDWLKARSWDVPAATLPELRAFVGAQAGRLATPNELARWMRVRPAARPMPEALAAEAVAWLDAHGLGGAVPARFRPGATPTPFRGAVTGPRRAYSPDQARDERGRFGEGSGDAQGPERPSDGERQATDELGAMAGAEVASLAAQLGDEVGVADGERGGWVMGAEIDVEQADRLAGMAADAEAALTRHGFDGPAVREAVSWWSDGTGVSLFRQVAEGRENPANPNGVPLDGVRQALEVARATEIDAPLYRGLALNESMVANLQPGDRLDGLGAASWSRDPEVARVFSGYVGMQNDTNVPIDLTIESGARGLDVSVMGDPDYAWQHEVLVPADAYVVTSVGRSFDGDAYAVTVEPVYGQAAATAAAEPGAGAALFGPTFAELARAAGHPPAARRAYSPDQARDDRGRFGEGGSGGKADEPAAPRGPVEGGVYRLTFRPTIGNDRTETVEARYRGIVDPDGRGPRAHFIVTDDPSRPEGFTGQHDLYLGPAQLDTLEPLDERARAGAARRAYSPDQERDERGRFGEGIGDYPALGAPVATMSAFEGLTDRSGRPVTDRITAQVERYMGTRDEVEARYQALVDRARGTDAWDRGAGWYQGWHDRAGAIADAHGLEPSAVAGALAAASPGMDARYEPAIIDAMAGMQAGTVGLDGERLDALNDKLDGLGLPRVETGQPYADLDSRTAVVAMHDEFTAGGGAGWGSQYGYAGATKALDCLRGADPDEVLQGPKVRAFYDCINDPSDPAQVTIDVMMMRAAADDPGLRNNGTVTSTPSATVGGVKTSIGPTPLLADVVRDIAAREGLTPLQAQAIIWTQWKDEHP